MKFDGIRLRFYSARKTVATKKRLQARCLATDMASHGASAVAWLGGQCASAVAWLGVSVIFPACIELTAVIPDVGPTPLPPGVIPWSECYSAAPLWRHFRSFARPNRMSQRQKP